MTRVTAGRAPAAAGVEAHRSPHDRMPPSQWARNRGFSANS